MYATISQDGQKLTFLAEYLCSYCIQVKFKLIHFLHKTDSWIWRHNDKTTQCLNGWEKKSLSAECVGSKNSNMFFHSIIISCSQWGEKVCTKNYLCNRLLWPYCNLQPVICALASLLIFILQTCKKLFWYLGLGMCFHKSSKSCETHTVSIIENGQDD